MQEVKQAYAKYEGNETYETRVGSEAYVTCGRREKYETYDTYETCVTFNMSHVRR